MPYEVDYSKLCLACPYGTCIEDLRQRPIAKRNTKFRMRQNTALACTFSDFVPGTDNDPIPHRTFVEYLARIQANSAGAGQILFGADFTVQGAAIAKVGGDIFELMEAAALWNAAAVWNQYMDTGKWTSNVFAVPVGAVPTPERKIAVVKLRRGYDPTLLFKNEVRQQVKAHEQSLQLRGMELGLSAPDIVGIRVPHPTPPAYLPFLNQLDNLGPVARELIEQTHRAIEGTLDGRGFLFAIAVKTSTRSDRLYQPLFEANVLKYLVTEVLRGAAFRFNVHMGSFEGADVEGHYRAASLVSLLRGGEPALAVDKLYLAEKPADTAQEVLNSFPLFPL